ncbi:MAG: LysE family translocator [Pseudomonadota bacterium]
MDALIPIFIFCLVTSITPGPNNIMLLASGLNHGVKKTLPHLFGIIVGFPTMVACIGLGLGAIFLQYPLIHQVIKVAGIAYLLFLAWKIANASNPNADTSTQKPFTFFQAALFQWLNPKAWIMAIGAIATFTTPENLGTNLLIILAGFLTMGSMSMSAWVFLGAGLQRILRSQQQLQIFNITMAVLLALSVISMVLPDSAT